jgi:hypothetical protein
VPAEEFHRVDSGESRARTGPRHAAPKKPLFTRLHMPAGKAIALASMPTAILMGMGFTPTLANAKDGVTNPFKDGPCVTKTDEPSESESPSASESPDKNDQDSSEESGKGDTAEPTPTPSSGSDSSSDSGSDDASGSGSSDPETKEPSGDDATSPSPSPSESESKNPLDPLGIGDALEDILTPDEKEEASASPSPTPSPSESGDTVEDTTDKVTDTVEDTAKGAEDAAKDTADKAEDTAQDATDQAKEAADEATASPSPSPSASEGEGGKEAYPCVVEKKVDGKDETTPVTLPTEPWYLESSGLLLEGLDYKGVVNVKTADGKTKQALKFTADKVDIGDLHQTVKDGQSGKTYHVEAAKGSTSTIRGGTVTMYTEKLQGNLFGLIPVTFDPEHPPPINTPIAYFTKVKITQAGQFGGTLTVPGLHQYVTD